MRVIIIAAATHAAGNPITWLKKSRRAEVNVALCTPKAIEPTPYNMLVLRLRGGRRFVADSDFTRKFVSGESAGRHCRGEAFIASLSPYLIIAIHRLTLASASHAGRLFRRFSTPYKTEGSLGKWCHTLGPICFVVRKKVTTGQS